jgi:hypothetical protein
MPSMPSNAIPCYPTPYTLLVSNGAIRPGIRPTSICY